jgi:hypothetical protein
VVLQLLLLLAVLLGRPRRLHLLAVGVQQVSGLEMLVKTRETFKLADLQFLTARALWEPAATAAAEEAKMCCERLVLDSRTGSSLLRLHKRGMVPDDKDEDDDDDDDDDTAAATSFVTGPFAAQIDWIGHVLATASSAASLVESIGRQQSQTWALDKPWTLRYLVMSSAAASAAAENPISKSIKEKPMICAVAQSIRSPRAALLVDDDDDENQTARLLILRVVVVNNDDNATLSETFTCYK